MGGQYVSEKPYARLLHPVLWLGNDCGTLFKQLVSVLLRRFGIDDPGTLGGETEALVINLSAVEYALVNNVRQGVILRWSILLKRI